MSTTASIIYEEHGTLAHVRLNRAPKRNALTSEMLERLAEIFGSLNERREHLRAVILSGEGSAFCAGTDIEELTGLDTEGATAAARRGQMVCDLIENCVVPVIAATNGIAAGGGCELAFSCHLRVCNTNAAFSLPETKLGLIPAYGGTQRLARITGSGRALELMLANARLTAEEALSCGLVNRVVEPAQLLAEAEALAREIASLAPLAIRACLEAVTRGQSLTLEEGLKLEAQLFSRLFSTADMREGTRAFLEKRPPVFQGK
ncbi:MAG: enoyl-CoA hydratase/isomerase family protein [Pyrinomonadaceae bacterium]|nr:enoyl-CoA hydratase/isomerase family protein [Pyrinomonadaceae bacterium]